MAEGRNSAAEIESSALDKIEKQNKLMREQIEELGTRLRLLGVYLELVGLANDDYKQEWRWWKRKEDRKRKQKLLEKIEECEIKLRSY